MLRSRVSYSALLGLAASFAPVHLGDMADAQDLPDDVVRLLAEVIHHTQNRSYQQANDAYLRLSIGNAAWPLGVTSVGIHARSSDNKITDNVAHVLNDEVSRKYIQAVKR
jgi:pre-mRNA-splicing factor 18